MILGLLRKYFNIILIFLVITLGFSLRIYNLGNNPAGFFCDEASIGYNAYTIITSGADEYGTPFPIFFRAFGEYKSPIEIYSTAPFVGIFGLSEFSTRLPSTIYGILSIIAIYFLAKEMFIRHREDNFIAIFSMFFLAISPWSIQFSRVSLEGLMAFVFFTTFGLFLFLKAQSKPNLFILSVISFTLALYSYFPARIFIPLFCLGLIGLHFKFFLQYKKQVLYSAILLLLLLIPFLMNNLSLDGLARWQQVSVFYHPPKNESIVQHITSDYFQHFSADFLFLKGDIDMSGQFITRHSVRGIGELYLFQLPLILAGIFHLFKKRKKLFYIFLLWIILYPTGSMFTLDNTPQATRSIIGVAPFQILTAVGLEYLLELFIKLDLVAKTKYILHLTFTFIIGLLIVLSFTSYLILYFSSYPNYSSDFWGWQYGARDIVQYFATNEQKYDEEIMAPEFNAPEIFFKFYAPNDCVKCKVGLPDKLYDPNKKQLFALTPDYLKNNPEWNFEPLEKIYYPNGTIAFLIGEIVQ